MRLFIVKILPKAHAQTKKKDLKDFTTPNTFLGNINYSSKSLIKRTNTKVSIANKSSNRPILPILILL